MGEMYLAVSPDEGRLLYLLARASRARYIAEFGASYGISTLYLGAAAIDNGGKLVTTEVHPDKCQAIRETLKKAGLEDTVSLLEGDARETLPAQPGGIDMLFLDGWKSQYLSLLEKLTPLLAPGCIVAADNVNHEAAGKYIEFIQSSADWFTRIVDDMAVSLYRS
jgi:predicted O-methyltransferase YrrM